MSRVFVRTHRGRLIVVRGTSHEDEVQVEGGKERKVTLEKNGGLQPSFGVHNNGFVRGPLSPGPQLLRQGFAPGGDAGKVSDRNEPVGVNEGGPRPPPLTQPFAVFVTDPGPLGGGGDASTERSVQPRLPLVVRAEAKRPKIVGG